MSGGLAGVVKATTNKSFCGSALRAVGPTPKDSIMNTDNNEALYVKVKDMAGNDFVCPLNELRDPRQLSEDELENCVEEVVVGRYAGQLKIVDPAG